MSAEFYLGLGAALLGLLAMICSTRRYRLGAAAAMSDAALIKHGLWDECDGEPMNEYAEEFERRHGLATQPKD